MRSLKSYLEQNPDAVVVVDLSGRVLFFNAPALGFFGRTADELAAECLIFSATQEVVELRVSRPLGHRIGELRLQQMDWGGAPALVATIRDVTQQRDLELQLLTTDRLASLGTLAAGVAHEINNPLAALLTNVSLAERRVDEVCGDAELKTLLRDSVDAGGRIRNIVRDLRDFSRSDGGISGPHDVSAILDTAIRLAGGELKHRAEIVRDYVPVPFAEVNESRLGQVFLNLLVNAAQAFPTGHTEGNRIVVRTRLGVDGRVVVSIEDNGPGIPPDVARRLFTPFFTTKPVGSGTGLGLAISQRIVRSFGGEISFDTELGKGTSFSVHLCPSMEPVSEPPPPKRPSAPTRERRGTRVLLVDDDPAVLRAARRALNTEHDVTAFDRAKSALEVLRDGERFDCIVCDLMMPGMSGVEFCERLRGMGMDQRLMLLTGGAISPEVRRFLESTAYPRIEKPFDPEQLREAISAALAA